MKKIVQTAGRNALNEFAPQFAHFNKLSHEIAEAYDVVAVEDIDMKAMSQCMHFGKSVMDNGY